MFASVSISFTFHRLLSGRNNAFKNTCPNLDDEINSMKRHVIFLIILLFPCFCSPALGLVQNKYAKSKITGHADVFSPDGKTGLYLRISQDGKLQYRMVRNHRDVLLWSDLGLNVNGNEAGENCVILSVHRSQVTEDIRWPLGEKELIKNQYHQLVLECRSGIMKFSVVTRVFDGSIAFKYVFPEQKDFDSVTINKERTTFCLPVSCKIYQYHHESVFTPTITGSLNTTCDFPATLTAKQTYISIGEANNINYTKAELKRGDKANSLAVEFVHDDAVHFSGKFETPWRTVSFSETAAGLHQFSDLYYKLCPPPTGEVPSDAYAGKVIRSQLTTESALQCIELAKKLNFRYIMFDAGWYGPEREQASDPRVPIPQIDLPLVIRKGKESGIGVILYVNYIALQAHLDEILPLYKKWGVQGLKFGFIDGFTQKGLTWLSSAIEKVNNYGLVLNIHDNYKPTGLSRTYPFLLTQEGIRGDENSPDAFHTTVLPFTRYLAGAADFTYCYPNSKNSFSKNLKVSKAQQLALTVVYYSPLQAIFWYGKPEDYAGQDDIEFFAHVPTVWDESLYLEGEPGENISVARRNGNTWFVGSAAGFNDWRYSLKLGFLDKGKTYLATVYEDDSKGGIRKRSLSVRKDGQIKLEISAKGGQAIILKPLE